MLDNKLFEKVNKWNKKTLDWENQGINCYFRTYNNIDNNYLTIDGDKKLSFSSYSYLGLLGDPRIAEAAKKAVDKYGTGSLASPVLGGCLDLHEELYEQIRKFTNRKGVFVFNTGYVTNLSTISSLIGLGDYVLFDRKSHASVVDGCQFNRGKSFHFKHNDMEDLERRLKKIPKEAGKLVVADSVFSMDGDIFPLIEASEICKKYGAILMIDEAHSVGVLGKNGRGIEEHFNAPGLIDIKMGTLSKTIPASGGYIAGDPELIDFLRYNVRGSLFSGALTAGVVAAAKTSFEIVQKEGAQRVEKLNSITNYFVSELQSNGFDTGVTVTPIIPIMINDLDMALRMTKFCYDRGIYIPPALHPVVHPGKERLRATVTANHTKEHIDAAVKMLIEASEYVGFERGK
ncbi:MAG: aminotransferase class I/II-fold pyridoxal phosphate-dependent enzyme [Magnetococcales bacterium]|nr:aminotransferase class I/II-fold pyridoxal phosphate-dependent enzyme [Magnetococcales bacterium]